MDIFQILASIASIISIPLAIHYARKNNSTTSEKARLDIIKTLSYRLSATHALTHEDIDSVYKSKLREHEIVNAQFTQEDILNDLRADIMSNAFLDNDIRNKILYNLSEINSWHSKSGLHICIYVNPFIKLFISPLPYVIFIGNIITCIILIFPYIFDTIYYCTKYNFLDNNFLDEMYISLYHNHYLHISLICLFVFSVICFCGKKYRKKFNY